MNHGGRWGGRRGGRGGVSFPKDEMSISLDFLSMKPTEMRKSPDRPRGKKIGNCTFSFPEDEMSISLDFLSMSLEKHKGGCGEVEGRREERGGCSMSHGAAP